MDSKGTILQLVVLMSFSLWLY